MVADDTFIASNTELLIQVEHAVSSGLDQLIDMNATKDTNLQHIRVEVPKWCAFVWFFGPFSFALFIIYMFSSQIQQDAIIILVLMLEQAFAIYCAPKLNSVGGGVMCSMAAMSLLLLWRGLTYGPIRSMMVMELMMNGGFRYIHLLSNTNLRHRSFTHRVAFVTIFSDVTTATYVESKQAWNESKKITRSIVVALSMAVCSWFCLTSVAVDVTSGIDSLNPAVLLTRTLVGALLIYSCLTIVDGLYRVSLVCVRPYGILCDSAMDAPYFANSFQSFWGQKWDRPMQTILFYGVFQPCRKLIGLSVGGSTVATFTASGFVHTVGTAACGWVDLKSCLLMMAFFVVQASFVLVEGATQRPAGVVVTQLCCWMSAPLFVLPFLQLLKL